MQRHSNTRDKRHGSDRTKERTPAAPSRKDIQEPKPTNNAKILGSDPLWQRVLEYPGAQLAITDLESDGMIPEATWAFLRMIDLSYDNDALRRNLPDSKELRRAAARIKRIGHEIAAFSRNTFMAPAPKPYAHFFAWLPGLLGAYSEYLQVQAYLFAAVGTTKPSSWKLHVIEMVEYVKGITRREHYAEIACLLTAVAAKHGDADVIDPQTLTMILQRHRKALRKSRSMESMPKFLQEAVKRVGDDISAKNRHKTIGQMIAAKFTAPSD